MSVFLDILFWYWLFSAGVSYGICRTRGAGFRSPWVDIPVELIANLLIGWLRFPFFMYHTHAARTYGEQFQEYPF